MSDLYESVPLSTVVKINSGIALPKIFKDVECTDGEYEFFKVAQMNNDAKVMKNSDLKFTSSQSKEFKIKLFPKGSVLIPKRGGAILTNKKRLLLEDASYDSNIMGLKANNEILHDDFLILYMDSINLSDYIDTSTIPQINNKHIDLMMIPLPPLSEQQRIVSKLDNLFKKIDKAIALHKKNIDEADVFIGSVLNDVFGELEEKYHNKTMDDICTKITDGTHSSPKTVEQGYPYITVRDVTSSGEIDFNNCEFVNTEDFQKLKKGHCAPIKNDVLFSKDGTVGKVTVVGFEKDFVVLSSLAILRPSIDLSSYFLYYAMKSPKFFDFAQSKKTGAAIKRVVLRTIKEFKIPLPPITIQQKVVKYLDEVSEKTEKVKLIQEEKMKNLKDLKASILDKAFRGEL